MGQAHRVINYKYCFMGLTYPTLPLGLNMSLSRSRDRQGYNEDNSIKRSQHGWNKVLSASTVKIINTKCASRATIL
ncbi:hypothetical protein K0M31_006858 [Melipona bicolor]|uniref:Uncharacterized protein n=1 Tax=Melipona bicolor TaxID=60889 RepID=A0AA40FTA5_9HYME|nr:hypothetical protein K0M31_006858 [Melipona bicolor]